MPANFTTTATPIMWHHEYQGLFDDILAYTGTDIADHVDAEPIEVRRPIDEMIEYVNDHKQEWFDEWCDKFVERLNRTVEIALGEPAQTAIPPYTAERTIDAVINRSRHFFAAPNPNGKVKIVFRNGDQIKTVPCDLILTEPDWEITDDEFLRILNIEEVPDRDDL